MIVRTGSFLWLASLTLLLCAACQGKSQSLALFNESKMDASIEKRPAYLDMMVANAAHRDMSVTDQHFVPHGSKLSGTGVARLNNMADFLDTHGGSVHYATYMTDEHLIKARLDQVKEYLLATGCNMDHVSLVAANSQSSWYLASDAVENMQADDVNAAPGGAAPPVAALAPPPGR